MTNTVTNANTITNSSSPYISCAMSVALIHGNNTSSKQSNYIHPKLDVQKLATTTVNKNSKKYQNYKQIQDIVYHNLDINYKINKNPCKVFNNKTERNNFNNCLIPSNNTNFFNSSCTTNSSKNRSTNTPKNKININIKKCPTYNRNNLLYLLINNKKIKNDKNNKNFTLNSYNSMKNIKKSNINKSYTNITGKSYINKSEYYTSNNIKSNITNDIDIEKQNINKLYSKDANFYSNNVYHTENNIALKTYYGSFRQKYSKSHRNSFSNRNVYFAEKNHDNNKKSSNSCSKINNSNANSKKKNINILGDLFKQFNGILKQNKSYTRTNSYLGNRNKKRRNNEKYYTLGDNKDTNNKNGRNKNKIPKNFKSAKKRYDTEIRKQEYQIKLEELKQRISNLFDNYTIIINTIQNLNINKNY